MFLASLCGKWLASKTKSAQVSRKEIALEIPLFVKGAVERGAPFPKKKQRETPNASSLGSQTLAKIVVHFLLTNVDVFQLLKAKLDLSYSTTPKKKTKSRRPPPKQIYIYTYIKKQRDLPQPLGAQAAVRQLPVELPEVRAARRPDGRLMARRIHGATIRSQRSGSRRRGVENPSKPAEPSYV